MCAFMASSRCPSGCTAGSAAKASRHGRGTGTPARSASCAARNSSAKTSSHAAHPRGVLEAAGGHGVGDGERDPAVDGRRTSTAVRGAPGQGVEPVLQRRRDGQHRRRVARRVPVPRVTASGRHRAEADAAADRHLPDPVEVVAGDAGDHRVAAGDRVVGGEDDGLAGRRDLDRPRDRALAGQLLGPGPVERVARRGAARPGWTAA